MEITGKPWTRAELKLLLELIREKAPAKTVAKRLGRTEKEVRSKINASLHLPKEE